MAPSSAVEGDTDTGDSPHPIEKSPRQTTQQEPEPIVEPGSTKESKSKTANGLKEKSNAAEAPNDGKTSGKEKKAKAKAEKAARRAQDKQKQQGQPVADLHGANKTDGKKEGERRGSATTQAKSGSQIGQHKRTGSTNLKTLPIRSTESQAAPVTEEPKREEKRVALLDHLYGLPRRTSLAGAGKDVHPAVLALGLQMSDYKICGSTARCAATLLVFRSVIESYTTPSHTSLTRHLTTHISSQIEFLVSCRPMSVSMGNAIRWLKVEISKIDVSTAESTAKIELGKAIDNFIRERITVADEVIAETAADRIKDGDTILTYAKSSVVQSTLVEAFRQGKRFKVIVVDSRPLFEGKNVARSLAALGIEVQYCLINGTDRAFKAVTKVFLGAHAMMSNGRLYSRIGTALVAMSAKEADIPVIVCCESIKFTDRAALDSFVNNEIAPPDELLIQGHSPSGLKTWKDVSNLNVLNLLYDLTPAEYINMVITEYGPLPPSSVPVVHRLSTNT